VIFVGRELGYPYTGLRLPLNGVFTQLVEEHQRGVLWFGDPLFDLDGIAVIAFGDKLLPDFERSRSETVETGVDLKRELVVAGGAFLGLIPTGRVGVALDVNLAFKPVGCDPRQDGGETVLARPVLSQQEQDAECVPFHNFFTF